MGWSLYPTPYIHCWAWLLGGWWVTSFETKWAGGISSLVFTACLFTVWKRTEHFSERPHASQKSWNITLASSSRSFIFLFSGHTDLSGVYCHKPAPSRFKVSQPAPTSRQQCPQLASLGTDSQFTISEWIHTEEVTTLKRRKQFPSFPQSWGDYLFSANEK